MGYVMDYDIVGCFSALLISKYNASQSNSELILNIAYWETYPLP